MKPVTLLAPRNFRWKHIKFPEGRHIVTNREDLAILKKVPITIAEIKMRGGGIINKPKKKKAAKPKTTEVQDALKSTKRPTKKT